MKQRLLIDSNILALLAVGTTSRSYVLRHKATKAYSIEDFDLLMNLCSQYREIVFTPHTLTETSNLLCRGVLEPARTEIMKVLQLMIDRTDEVSLSSSIAAQLPEFLRLGLTDAALISLSDETLCMATDNLDLFLAASAAGHAPTYFTYLRIQHGTLPG